MADELKHGEHWVTVNHKHILVDENGNPVDDNYEDELEPINIEEYKKNINPNFGKKPGYNVNCQKCVIARELANRGIVKHVKPEKPVNEYDMRNYLINYHLKNHKDDLLNNSFGYNSKIGVNVAKNWLKETPNSRWYISIPWKCGLGSHAFYASVDNKGKVIFENPQNPKLNPNDFFKYMSYSSKKRINFLRIDNVDFDEEFLNKGDYFENE